MQFSILLDPNFGDIAIFLCLICVGLIGKDTASTHTRITHKSTLTRINEMVIILNVYILDGGEKMISEIDCMLGYFFILLVGCCFFSSSQITIFKTKYFRHTIRMPNSLDPDQVRRSNCLQRLSANDNGKS